MIVIPTELRAFSNRVEWLYLSILTGERKTKYSSSIAIKEPDLQKMKIRRITESLKQAGNKEIDLIEINYESDARYLAAKVFNRELQIDRYDVPRGTCIIIDKTKALLWTHGIVPSVQNPNYSYYLGGRSISAPLKITKHYGNSNINLEQSKTMD